MDEEVGSLAEEAAKLADAVAGWASRQGPDAAGAGFADLTGSAGRAWHDVNQHLATDPECRYCPVCRAVQVARQLTPEVRQHLTSAAFSLLQAGSALLATVQTEDAEADADSERSRRGRSEHIALDDQWPDEGACEGEAGRR